MPGSVKPESIRLSDEHVGMLRRTLQRAEAIRPVWDRLEECGVDCAERKQILDEATRQCRLLLAHFGPEGLREKD